MAQPAALLLRGGAAPCDTSKACTCSKLCDFCGPNLQTRVIVWVQRGSRVKQDPANSAEEPSWHLLKPSGTLRGASSILIAQSNASLFSCHSNPLEKEVKSVLFPFNSPDRNAGRHNTEPLANMLGSNVGTGWNKTLDWNYGETI